MYPGPGAIGWTYTGNAGGPMATDTKTPAQELTAVAKTTTLIKGTSHRNRVIASTFLDSHRRCRRVVERLASNGISKWRHTYKPLSLIFFVGSVCNEV